MNINPLLLQAKKDLHVNHPTKICKCCGSTVSTYNANAQVVAVRPEANNWDWWAACDNADCENAYGEGYLQLPVDWTK